MTDEENNFAPNTSLSAEAKTFIPSHLKGTGHNVEQTNIVNNIDGVQGLPKYMTNCYPFVQNDVNQQFHGTAPHHLNGEAHHRLSGPRTAFNSAPVIFNNMNPRMPGSHPFNSAHMSTRPQQSPHVYPPHAQPGLMSPPLMNGSHQQNHLNHFVPSQGYQSMPRAPMSPQGWMTSPPPRMPYPHNVMGQYQTGPRFDAHHSKKRYTFDQRGRHKKKHGDWNNMVSVGIQNEAAAHYNHPPPAAYGNQPMGPGQKKKNKPRTLICMDAAIQTDFSDELANKTLLEQPSSLYQEERMRNRRHLYHQDSTSDSEVDSDSGYSTPMHRRNQSSSGTHPLSASGLYLASPPQGIPPPHPPNSVAAGVAYPPLSAVGYSTAPVFAGYAKAVAGYKTEAGPNHVHAPRNFATHPDFNTHLAGPMGGGAVRPSRWDNFGKQVPSVAQTNKPMQQSPVRHTSPAKINYSAAVSKHPQAQSRAPVTSSAQSAFSNGKKLQNSQTNTNVISVSHSSNQVNSGPKPPAKTQPRAKTEGEEDEGAISSGSKPKRKRTRRRRSKKGESPEHQSALSDGQCDLVRAHSSSNVSRSSTVENEILHFEDEDEFPNLLSAVGGLQAEGAGSGLINASYCDILKGQVPSHLSQDSAHSFSSGGGFKSSPELSSLKETKNARKKRRRREAIDQAADAELAEITLEQQVLRQLSAKSSAGGASSGKEKQRGGGGGGGKRSNQPISLNIADMISALEKQDKTHDALSAKQQQHYKPVQSRKEGHRVANVLDSSAPVKRGKEREVAKAKKPSPLKKVILKEREEKKRLRLLEDGVTVADVTADVDDVTDTQNDDTQGEEEEEVRGEGLSPTSLLAKCSSQELQADASADLSPISQTSPISMSPLSGSPLNSGFTSPIANQGAASSSGNSSVLARIHSRRFREYCTQVLDKDIDNCCMALLQELVRFQDRLYQKDPNKAKSKRRIVLGLREVTKHLKMKKIKCVMISPNLERIQSKGGLDEALNNIILIAQEQNVPVVFALGRRALGRACAKLVPVSVVGIFNYEGCDEYFKRLMDMTKKARDAYKDMVVAVEKELQEQRNAMATSSTHAHGIHSGGMHLITDVPRLFSHMGHSRTPSGCSGISLTSSILSEPISENYPYSEPETDSRGYEIVRNGALGIGKNKSRDEGTGETLEEKLQKIEYDLREIEEQEIDEGNEADTEDDVIKRDVTDADNASKAAASGAADVTNTDKTDLPHFDSIHAKGTDLKDDEQNEDEVGDNLGDLTSLGKSNDLSHSSEVMSTHSSKTLEAGRSSPDLLSHVSSLPDVPESSPVSGAHKVTKTMNNERIEEWVAKTQKQVGMLSIADESEEKTNVTNEMNKDIESPVGDNEEAAAGDNEEEAGTDVADNVSERISLSVTSDPDEENDRAEEDVGEEEEGEEESTFHDCLDQDPKTES